MLPTKNVTSGRYFPFLGISDGTMDIVTTSRHMTIRNDSARQEKSNGVNIKSVAQLDAELLTSEPGSATNFMPN